MQLDYAIGGRETHAHEDFELLLIELIGAVGGVYTSEIPDPLHRFLTHYSTTDHSAFFIISSFG